MDIYSCQEAFGASDKTTDAMRSAAQSWFDLYYRDSAQEEDPCQRIAYTVVSKLVRTVFGEYAFSGENDFTRQVLEALDEIREKHGYFAVRRAVMLTDEALGSINPREDHVLVPEPYFKKTK